MEHEEDRFAHLDRVAGRWLWRRTDARTGPGGYPGGSNGGSGSNSHSGCAHANAYVCAHTNDRSDGHAREHGYSTAGAASDRDAHNAGHGNIVPAADRPQPGAIRCGNVRSDDALNVRAGPGVGYAIAGTIPYYGRDVDLLVGGQQVGDSWWVSVRHDGVSGWVNSGFLARQEGWASDPVAARAAEAIMALKDGDMVELSSLIHPSKGVRFSPYATVQTGVGGDLVFSASQVRNLMRDPTVHHWGVYDGSGKPIDLAFRLYYDEFVYGVEFARPDVVGFDEMVGQGNSINNIASAYPNGVMVEYHFEGFDPQYAGMDWRSLRLVFEEQAGIWYLVGIVHDQWTI